MSKILEFANMIMRSVIEVAEVEVVANEPASAEEEYITYLTACLIRSDKILDQNKQKVFNSVLNLPTRGRVERAIVAYDKHFLLSQNLSLDSTSELAKALIEVAKRFKVAAPRDWVEMSRMDIELLNSPIVVNTRKKISL